MKVSFFIHDLASNPVGRTIALAGALQSVYDVEMLGLLISGDDVYQPYRDRFKYTTVRCKPGLKNIFTAGKTLAKLATGDVIYACKPLITSLVPAIRATGIPKRRPLFLDVDDDHWGSPESGFLRDPLSGFRDMDGWGYTRLLHPAKMLCDGITVVSTSLQRRYGGELLRHGPDEREFDPGNPAVGSQGQCRQRFGLPVGPKLAIFAGTPHPHKGLDTITGALLKPACEGWNLVLVAPPEHPGVQEVKRALGSRCWVLGFQSYSAMPALLTAADAVPIPQNRVRFAEGQIPAKLFDAMSMSRPICASAVGDLPSILGEDRGWIFEPGSADGLANALAEIGNRPNEARRRGANARAWYLQNASATAIRNILTPMIKNSLLRHGRKN